MAFARSRKSEIVLNCLNQSTVVSDTDFSRWMSAQQQQIDNEFGAEWDTVCKIASSKLEPVPASAWQFLLLDDSDQANALGYHDDVKGANGQPIAKAFARTDVTNGYKWTVTASHEVMETLGDPDINRVIMADGGVFGGPRGQMILVAYEICDACEADSFGKTFRIGGARGADVVLSDFVTRAWFESAQGALVDAYGHLTAPWQIANGGYIGLYVPGRGWTQAFHNRALEGDFKMGSPALRILGEEHGVRHADLATSPRRKARFETNVE